MLDTTTNTWHWEQPQILGAGPCARTGHTATLVADNTIAIVGGWDPNVSGRSRNGHCECSQQLTRVGVGWGVVVCQDESDAKPFSDVFLLDTGACDASSCCRAAVLRC